MAPVGAFWEQEVKTAETRIASQDFPLLCDLYPGGSFFFPLPFLQIFFPPNRQPSFTVIWQMLGVAAAQQWDELDGDWRCRKAEASLTFIRRQVVA